MKPCKKFTLGATILISASVMLIGCASLMRSTYRNDVTGVMKCIARGEDVNQRDKYLWAPLHWAAYYDYIGVISSLLDNGADPNCRTGKDYGRIVKGSTPLQFAVYNSSQQATFLLLKRIKKGDDINQKDRFQWAPLHWAVYNNDVDVMAALLEKGADPNCRTGKNSGAIKKGSTPLLIAAFYRRPETVRLLLQYKADPNIPNDLGRTPLDYAQQYSSDEIISVLLGLKEYDPEKEMRKEMLKPLVQRIRMKDGRTIAGTIESQSQTGFTVKTGQGTIIIEKEAVDEIRFK